MTNNKARILNFFSSILIFISFLTPAAIPSKAGGELVWIWGFKLNSSIKMINNVPAFNICIIFSLLLLILTIIAIITAIKGRIERSDFICIILGLIIIILVVIWAAAINILLRTGIEKESTFGTYTEYTYFWETHYIGFGIIGIISGGILMILAGFLYTHENKIKESTDKPIKAEQKSENHQYEIETERFCFYCGATVNLGEKYCKNCNSKIDEIN